MVALVNLPRGKQRSDVLEPNVFVLAPVYIKTEECSVIDLRKKLSSKFIPELKVFYYSLVPCRTERPSIGVRKMVVLMDQCR
jgi:hypothetical protein